MSSKPVFTTISSSVGVQSSVAADSVTGSYGFAPYRLSTRALVSGSAGAVLNTINVNPSDAGLLTLSGTGAALTCILPRAADCAGAWFTFRSLTADAHVLTGSQEAQGTKVFSSMVPMAVGSKLTLSSAIGASVTVLCDGVNFNVVAVRTGSVGNGVSVSGN